MGLPMYVEFPTIVGSVGVGLLLLAYLLNLLKRISQDSKTYVILNILGAGLACYSSYLISFIPFVVLEGTWLMVSLMALTKVLGSEKKHAV